MSICPNCGSTNTRAVKHEKGQPEPFLIVDNRVCQDCGCRFTPPIPKWAPFGLILLGGILSAFAVVYLVTGIVSFFMPMNVVWSNGILIVLAGGVALLGVGIKAMTGRKIKNNLFDEFYGDKGEQKQK